MGKVLHVLNVLNEGSGRSKGSAVAEFATPGDAQNGLIILNDTEFKGRKVYLREHREDGKGSMGVQLSVPMPQYFTQVPTNSYNSHAFHAPYGGGIVPAYSMPFPNPFPNPYPMPYQNQLTEPTNGIVGHFGRKLYVSNLAWDVEWQDLKDHFKQVVHVLHCEIFTGKDGKSRGCAIVELARPEDVALAINSLNNTMLKGRPVFVREDRDAGKF